MSRNVGVAAGDTRWDKRERIGIYGISRVLKLDKKFRYLYVFNPLFEQVFKSPFLSPSNICIKGLVDMVNKLLATKSPTIQSHPSP